MSLSFTPSSLSVRCLMRSFSTKLRVYGDDLVRFARYFSMSFLVVPVDASNYALLNILFGAKLVGFYSLF